MPASTALITDSTTMATNGVTAATQAKAINATGPIQDMLGHIDLYNKKLYDCFNLLTAMKAATDAADPNLTLINNALLTLT